MNLNCGVFKSVLFTYLKKLVCEVFPIFLAQSVHEIRVESGLDYGTACVEPHLSSILGWKQVRRSVVDLDNGGCDLG